MNLSRRLAPSFVRNPRHDRGGRPVLAALLVFASSLGCGGATTEGDITPSADPSSSADHDAGASVAPSPDAGTSQGPTPVGADAGSAGNDAGGGTGSPPTTDASSPPPPPPSDGSVPPSSGDGPPTRRACTSNLGSGLSTTHGRLDGTIVAVIAPGQDKQCNGDSSHVHIQVAMGGAVYDVAANVDGNEMERDGALVGGAWSEGWHDQATLDYPTSLGVHSTQFGLTGISSVSTEVEKRLAQANHVSVFCTGYGPTGCHLVHRQKGGHDGAIVLDPLSATPHWLLFDFSTDTF